MRPAWDGKAITDLVLYRERDWLGRLDVWPFAPGYAALVAAARRFGWSPLALGLALGALLTLHVLTWLGEHWSVRFRAWVTLCRARSVERATQALVVPRPHHGPSEIVPLQRQRSQDGERFIEFQKRRYEYSADASCFRKLKYPAELSLTHYRRAWMQGGLSAAEAAERRVRYGLNRLHIPAPRFWELYKEQIMAPFFAFQIFCTVLWCLDEMWKYSLSTMGMLLLFEGTVVWTRLRMLRELRGMRARPVDTLVYRERKWQRVSSEELVPGDVISLTATSGETVVPCDTLLLAGNAIVNEAVLTGESVPLTKDALPATLEVGSGPAGGDRALEPLGADKPHVLFSGTSLLQHTAPALADPSLRSAPDGGCVGYVLRTGFGSSQGKLMRTMMHSTESFTANNRESLLCILFLLMFALIASGYVLRTGLQDRNWSRYELLLHCIQIITSVVPPDLPSQLSLAVQSALGALAKQGIFCTEPFRIPLAGTVDVCCFDKTGTLTSDAMQFAGVALPGGDAQLVEPDRAPLPANLVVAACHSLVRLQGVAAGDPLEVSALSASPWTYSPNDTAVCRRGSHQGLSVRIVQRHAFVAALQRMSVIAVVEGSNSTTTPQCYALVKGSPEAVRRLLRDVPAHYDRIYQRLSLQGMRVLAMATKTFPSAMRPGELTRLPRTAVECELECAGFLAFQCPPRPDSRPAVKMLRNASYRVVVITGDGVHTANYVARATGICQRRKPGLILEVVREASGAATRFCWVKPTRYGAGDAADARPFRVQELPQLESEHNLAVCGTVLEAALAADPAHVALLRHLQVYARMTPSQKEAVLMRLKDLGLHVLMCGDGTNDVGALKQAHVGVALLQPGPKRSPAPVPDGQPAPVDAKSELRRRHRSPAAHDAPSQPQQPPSLWERLRMEMERAQERAAASSNEDAPLVRLGDASIASPFTSRRMSIAPCVDILRQGRCTLVMTVQMYQIVSLECLISSYILSVLYLNGLKFGDQQMTAMGMLGAFASYMISHAPPVKKLSVQRPPRSMFAPRLFVSLLGQFGVHLATMVMAAELAKAALPPEFSAQQHSKFEPNLLNTVVFLVYATQQASVFLANYKGEPFMRGLRQNRLLLYALLICAGTALAAALEVSPELNTWLQLVSMPGTSFRVRVVAILLLDFVGVYAWDRVIACLL
ncbi:hypothetical protein CDCA_CDCA07G2101 [Cyanidium caldarium]|uniref:Cation-transporting ATPase n=1 Tax=Cyanidium caldarium TaxID=2771 RepID=A0AAV9IV92_CYACA|nr:hypothetical protein CDCA_CDCA07G2101 [Cyanidium caldarium]